MEAERRMRVLVIENEMTRTAIVLASVYLLQVSSLTTLHILMLDIDVARRALSVIVHISFLILAAAR
jgi:hypothetical protein